MKVSTLRPGLLVSLKTSVVGNVTYSKRDLDVRPTTVDGAEVTRWETERVIDDPAEHRAACTARTKARNEIRSVCAASAFGLLCPESSGDKLDAAILAARRIMAEFNSTARQTRVELYVIAGKITPDDVEAVRAINSEVRELLTAMEEGVRSLDVAKIRDAADRARGVGSMLSPDAAARARAAIDAARGAARRIVRVGNQAAQEVDQAAIAAITEARTAFLDIDGPSVDETTSSASPVVGTVDRELDLDPSYAVEVAAPMVDDHRERLDIELEGASDAM